MSAIANNRAAVNKIVNRETFRNARTSFSGDVIERGANQALRHVGYLPKGFHASLARADYVVYSYSTPIGWHVPGEGWHVPEVTYSATTSSRHQPILREAVTPILRRAHLCVEGSAAAADILRSIRAGYTVSVNGRTRRVVDLLLATGEAEIDQLSVSGKPLLLAPKARRVGREGRGMTRNVCAPDCDERATCAEAGTPGHSQCGTCATCARPVHHCSGHDAEQPGDVLASTAPLGSYSKPTARHETYLRDREVI